MLEAELPPLEPVPSLPPPMPEPEAVAMPASPHVPRVSTIVFEARTACAELMQKKSDDVLTETEMAFVRESLKATLGIPGSVVAMFSAFGHLGGLQEIASRTQVSAEGVKFLQSRLNIWLSKRGESGGMTRTAHLPPIGPPGPAVEVTNLQKVFTAPVTAGSLTGLYLTVAFADAPDRYAHEFLAENLNQLQTAIEQSFSRTTLQRTRLRAAERLLQPEFTSYPELKRHTEVVVALADRFAREVDLPPRESEQLHLLAMVHDVGMRMLEYDRLYLKRDIREEELNVLREHVFVSAAMVEPFLGSEIAKAVLCHHERVDGLGYPNEIRGEEIPLLSRMLQLCDAWASITEPQGYQAAESPEMAAAVLARGSGTQFDADLTMRFLAMIKGGR